MIGLILALAAAAPSAEAYIDRVGRDGVMQHVPDGTDGLWVQSFKGDWYYGRFAGPCARLGDSYGLGFDASPNDRFDRFSSVIADGERCPFASFVRSDPPPPKPKRR